MVEPMATDAQHRSVYPPLDTLKPVAPDIWIVDSGPLQSLGLSLPLRMTVIRLASGDLWLHSPTAYDAALRRELDRLGPVRHLVAPNVAHWSFLQEWQANLPEATSWAAPGLRRRAPVRKSGVRLDHEIGATAPRAWADDIDQAIVPGGFGFTEIAFLHRPSRTLILTDLIENFEPAKVAPMLRPLFRLAGVMAPNGSAPRHVRFVVNRRRAAAETAVRRLLEWNPQRVVFAHGRWFDREGTAALRRSFQWLLK
jgi:hypothetical protein